MPEKNDRSASEASVSEAPASSAVAAKATGDLSAQIAGTVDRLRGDVVRCTHVGGDRYRCNWWAPAAAAGYSDPVMPGLLVTTHRVRQSQFLRVTKTSAGRLDILILAAGAK